MKDIGNKVYSMVKGFKLRKMDSMQQEFGIKETLNKEKE